MEHKSVYIFNSDNDLSLADGREDYIAPAPVRKMEDDLSLLPVWWAKADSAVLVSSIAMAQSWKDKYKGVMPDAAFVSLLQKPDFSHFYPWGWNLALRKKLLRWGVEEAKLPTQYEMETVRKLSNRSLAVDLLKQMNTYPFTCGRSFCCHSEENVMSCLDQTPQFILKAPWSSSGKGLRRGSGTLLQNWYRRILSNQGSIIVEPFYEKVRDFAMEFYIDEAGIISWLGYSLFITDSNGRYKSNCLMSDQRIEQVLSSYVPNFDWLDFRSLLMKKLTSLLGLQYTGYFGVDMLVARFEEAPFYRIHPCVEINLRMNMGIVSRLFYDKCVVEQSTGTFAVTYFPSSSDLCVWHAAQEKEYPLCVKEGRIHSGYCSLTPIGKHTQYLAYVLIS